MRINHYIPGPWAIVPIVPTHTPSLRTQLTVGVVWG